LWGGRQYIDALKWERKRRPSTIKKEGKLYK